MNKLKNMDSTMVSKVKSNLITKCAIKGNRFRQSYIALII